MKALPVFFKFNLEIDIGNMILKYGYVLNQIIVRTFWSWSFYKIKLSEYVIF